MGFHAPQELARILGETIDLAARDSSPPSAPCESREPRRSQEPGGRLRATVALRFHGAVLPILQLNGYTIAKPTVLACISHEELEHLFRGYGYS
jgi:hypothetical protein